MAQIDFKGETVVCKVCGTSFYISAEEGAWFDRKELHRPGRCSLCRKRSRRNAIIGDKTEFSDEEFQRIMSKAKGEIARWER